MAASRLLAFMQRPIGALLAAFVAVFTIYAPALSGQFLWDDTWLVKNNLLIRSPLFVCEVFRHTLFNDASNFYRPTQTLTFLGDYYFWGLDPFGYHLTSVLIHAANAFLLCLVLRRVLPVMLGGAADQRLADWIALGVALAWAVHPVHNAAVAYISGTADTLAMTFCLTAVLLCERALRSSRPPSGVASAAGGFVCLLLGLCAKEIASIWLVLYLRLPVRFAAGNHAAPTLERGRAGGSGPGGLPRAASLAGSSPGPAPHAGTTAKVGAHAARLG